MYKEPQELDVGHLFSSFTDVSWGSLSSPEGWYMDEDIKITVGRVS